MESLPESSKMPQLLTDYTTALSAAELRAPLEKFLTTRQPTNFPAIIKERLLATSRNDPSDPKYNQPLINSLVLHLGNSALKSGGSFDATSIPTALLRQLINEMEPEGQSFLSSPDLDLPFFRLSTRD